MPSEMKQSVPRVPYSTMESDPELEIAVGEKGGISVKGLQRFPVTLYLEQWERLLNVGPEILIYADTNKAKLSDGRSVESKGKPDEGYTINQSDLAVLDVAIKTAQEANDVPGAIKYATIKSVATLNRNKVSPEHMLEIMTLKAKKV